MISLSFESLEKKIAKDKYQKSKKKEREENSVVSKLTENRSEREAVKNKARLKWPKNYNLEAQQCIGWRSKAGLDWPEPIKPGLVETNDLSSPIWSKDLTKGSVIIEKA